MVINKLIYPIFLSCCEFSKDNFWKFIFEDLAYGNCPYGTYIVKNYICCNYKGKEFMYTIFYIINLVYYLIKIRNIIEKYFF